MRLYVFFPTVLHHTVTKEKTHSQQHCAECLFYVVFLMTELLPLKSIISPWIDDRFVFSFSVSLFPFRGAKYILHVIFCFI